MARWWRMQPLKNCNIDLSYKAFSSTTKCILEIAFFKNYRRSKSGGWSLLLLVWLFAFDDRSGRIGFLPLPFPSPRPEGGGGASFKGLLSWAFGETKKSSTLRGAGCGVLWAADGMLHSLILNGWLEVFSIESFDAPNPLPQLACREIPPTATVFVAALPLRGGQSANGSKSSSPACTAVASNETLPKPPFRPVFLELWFIIPDPKLDFPKSRLVCWEAWVAFPVLTIALPGWRFGAWTAARGAAGGHSKLRDDSCCWEVSIVVNEGTTGDVLGAVLRLGIWEGAFEGTIVAPPPAVFVLPLETSQSESHELVFVLLLVALTFSFAGSFKAMDFTSKETGSASFTTTPRFSSIFLLHLKHSR